MGMRRGRWAGQGRVGAALAAVLAVGVTTGVLTTPAHGLPAPVTTSATSGAEPDSEPAGPDYPDPVPSDDGTPNLEEGERAVPSVDVRTDHLDVAIMDQLAGEIDADALVAAVENAEVMDVGNRRILLAVDREPAGSPHARSMAGSMILMVHPEILRDDWPNHPEGSTLVGRDWMIVTVILPETLGERPADVYFQEGLNVDLEGSGEDVTAAIAAAGAEQLDRGEYTAGLESMLAATVEHTSVQPLRWPWAVGIGAAAVLATVLTTVISRFRRRQATASEHQQRLDAATAAGTDLSELLGPRSREALDQLRAVADQRHDGGTHPGAHGTGSVRRVMATQLAALPEVIDRVVHEAVQEPMPPAYDRELASRLGVTVTTYSLLAKLLTRDPAADRVVLRGALDAHRERLRLVARVLEVPGLRATAVGREALTVTVDHTRALDELAAEITRWQPGQEAEHLLDRLESLRQEVLETLQGLQRAARDESSGSRGASDDASGALAEAGRVLTPIGYGPGERLADDDHPLEMLELAGRLEAPEHGAQHGARRGRARA